MVIYFWKKLSGNGITLNLANKYYNKTSYPNDQENNKRFFVETQIDLDKKDISINFHEDRRILTIGLNQNSEIPFLPKIYFNAIEAPPIINLSLTQTYNKKIDYHLNVESQNQEPNTDNCRIVSEEDFVDKFQENIEIYLHKTLDEQRIKCPKFYEEKDNLITDGNWNAYATKTHYIIISTNPITDTTSNNYSLIKVIGANIDIPEVETGSVSTYESYAPEPVAEESKETAELTWLAEQTDEWASRAVSSAAATVAYADRVVTSEKIWQLKEGKDQLKNASKSWIYLARQDAKVAAEQSELARLAADKANKLTLVVKWKTEARKWKLEVDKYEEAMRYEPVAERKCFTSPS